MAKSGWIGELQFALVPTIPYSLTPRTLIIAIYHHANVTLVPPVGNQTKASL